MSEPLHGNSMTTDDWLAWAGADADRRGLPELKPLLAALAGAQRTLRAADWNEDARTGPGPSGEDAARPDKGEGRP
jgi:hypothetical protein